MVLTVLAHGILAAGSVSLGALCEWRISRCFARRERCVLRRPVRKRSAFLSSKALSTPLVASRTHLVDSSLSVLTVSLVGQVVRVDNRGLGRSDGQDGEGGDGDSELLEHLEWVLNAKEWDERE